MPADPLLQDDWLCPAPFTLRVLCVFAVHNPSNVSAQPRHWLACPVLLR